MSGPGDNVLLDWASQLDELDGDIRSLQDAKRDLYTAIRDSHGKVTANALKAAQRLRSMDSEKRAQAEETDAETARILAVLERAACAPRATREIIEEIPPHDPETGELADIDVAMFDEPDSSEPNSSPAETDKPGEVPPPSSSGTPSEIPAPHHLPDADGRPGKQGFVAGGAKMDGAPEAPPGRAASAEPLDAKTKPAVTPFTEDDVPAFLRPPKPQKPLRAGCLEPECCASYSAGLCHRCTKSAASAAA